MKNKLSLRQENITHNYQTHTFHHKLKFKINTKSQQFNCFEINSNNIVFMCMKITNPTNLYVNIASSFLFWSIENLENHHKFSMNIKLENKK